MYRLVMRDPIPEEMETLHAICYVSPNPPCVTCRWVLCERRGESGYPQRSVVCRFAKVPPEPESEFGYHLAMHLRLASLGCASAGIGYCCPGLVRLSTSKEMPLLVPGILPPLSRAVSDERIIHRVAEENLETAEVFVKGGASPDVPIVQVDGIRYAAPSRLEVRVEPFPREAVGDQLVIDAWRLSHSTRILGSESPGTVPASANGRGYAFPR